MIPDRRLRFMPGAGPFDVAGDFYLNVTGAGFSHAPAVELAERLLALGPRQAGRAPLAKVFYADNGSAGVEVAKIPRTMAGYGRSPTRIS